jgi:hypothetical protein
MGALKETKINGRKAHQVGLLANGSSGSWEVAIDETISGKDRWFAQLEGRTIYVYFEIPTPSIVGEVIRYLENGNTRGNSRSVNRGGGLLIGGDKRTPVTLMRDDEFADRVFLVIGPASAPVVRYTISGTDINKIIEALRQVKEDLES